LLIHWLAGELAEIMGVADAAAIDPHRGFADLGLDSMMAAQLAEAVHRGLNVDLSVIAVLNYPTLSDLTAHLLPESPAARAASAPASLDEDELIAQIAARFEESHGR
jgi:acyl carrier protein